MTVAHCPRASSHQRARRERLRSCTSDVRSFWSRVWLWPRPWGPRQRRRAAEHLPAGLVPLFNGKDFTGWHGLKTMDPVKFEALKADEKAKLLAEGAVDLKKHWRVEDGVIINDGQGVYLTTDKDYGDIELVVDFKIGPKGDSGVYLRGTPQVQIWDFTEPSYRSLPGRQRLRRPVEQRRRRARQRPAGQGRQSHRRVEHLPDHSGRRAHHDLLERQARCGSRHPRELTGSVRCRSRPAVRFSSRLTTTRSCWRNIAVREIPPDEANQILAKHGAEGFHSIFNGQNLADWAGPIENYEVKDGSLRCKEHKGGTIYYNHELTDFVARLEFKLPPGGNNGLAIRYPGHGDTAYHRHVRAPDSGRPSPQVRQAIDPRQAHGSAYGMVAAHKGYLRPTGQWNFRGGHRQRPQDQGRAQRHRDPGRRPEQGQGIHGQLRSPGQGPHVRVLRVRRAPRSGRVPQCRDQDFGLRW